MSNANNMLAIDKQKLNDDINKMKFELNTYKEAYERNEKLKNEQNI